VYFFKKNKNKYEQNKKNRHSDYDRYDDAPPRRSIAFPFHTEISLYPPAFSNNSTNMSRNRKVVKRLNLPNKFRCSCFRMRN